VNHSVHIILVLRAGLKQLNIWHYIELVFLVPRTVTYINSYIILRISRAKNKDVKLSVTSFSRVSSTKTSGAIPTTANNEVPRALTSLHEGTSHKTASSQGRLSSLTPHLLCTHQLTRTRHQQRLTMDALRCQQLIKQRSMARGMLLRIQNFIEAGDQKINDIQVRSNKLPDIFNRYDTAE